jgi:hypothetical protein
MSALDFGIQAMLGAPTAADFTAKENQNTAGNIGIQNMLMSQQYAKALAAKNLTMLQQGQDALKAWVADPQNAEKRASAFAFNSDKLEALKAANQGLDTRTQSQLAQDTTALHGYAQQGLYSRFADTVEDMRQALKKQGLPTDEEDTILRLAQAAQDKTNPELAAQAGNALKAMTQQLLYVHANEAFQKNYSDFNTTESKDKLQGAQANQADATATNERATAYRTMNPLAEWDLSSQVDANGNPLKIEKHSGETQSAANQVTGEGGAPSAYNTYLANLGGAEGTGKNPQSTANNLGQFVDGTWVNVAKQLPWGQGKTEAQLKAMKNSKDPKIAATPEQRQEALDQLNKNNYKALQDAKLDTNATHMYTAHLLGPTAAAAVLHTSNPNTPLKDVLVSAIGEKKANEYINANKRIMQGKTVGEFIAPIYQKFGTAQVNPFVSRTTAQGQDYLEASDPDQANMIDSVAKGLIPIDQIDTTRAGRREAVVKQVLRVNPNWSPGLYEAQQKVREDFTSGDKNTSVNAVNTFFQHVLEYDAALNERKEIFKKNITGDYADGTNQLRNWFSNNHDTGVGRNNSKLEQVATNLAEEETSAYKGSKGSDDEVKTFRKNLGQDRPIGLQKATLEAKALAMTARLNTLAFDHNRAFGENKMPFQFLDEPVQKGIIDLLQNHYSSAKTRNEPNRAQIQALQSGKLTPKSFDAKFGEGRSWIYLYQQQQQANNE